MKIEKKLESIEKRLIGLEHRFSKFECDIDSECPYSKEIEGIEKDIGEIKTKL